MGDQADVAARNGPWLSTRFSTHANIVISPDFILHIIPRLIAPVGKEPLLPLRHRIPSRPSCLKVLLHKPPPRADSAPHTRYPVLLPHVVKVVTNHLAQIVDPDHGEIRLHCGQSINRCIPVVHRLFIGKEHGDLYLLCPGPRRGTFDFEHPCNDTLLQSGEHRQVTLKRELDPVYGFHSIWSYPPWTASFYWPEPHAIADEGHQDVSLIHPWGIGNSVLILLSLELANDHRAQWAGYQTCNVSEADGFPDILANPLLGLFFSPVTVALYRDDECNNSW